MPGFLRKVRATVEFGLAMSSSLDNTAARGAIVSIDAMRDAFILSVGAVLMANSLLAWHHYGLTY